jgi:cell division protein FtsW (lipid II flippase)
MQGSGQRPVDFVPEQHTDFVFSVTPSLLGFGVAIVAVAVVLWYYRRRRKDRGDQGFSPPAT